MRRSGPKGSGQFERITWDEALDEIGSRFRLIVNEYGGEAIMPVSYLGTQGILNGPKFIVVWACNIVGPNLHLWPDITEARKRGAKVVVVDPVLTRHRCRCRPTHP